MRTPSKVNLFLEVCGRRADGYHEIRTIFAPLSAPCDDVTVEPDSVPGIHFEQSGRSIFLPSGSDNLCVKAAERFCSQFGIQPSHRIHLQKQIPVSAGLGGGSSDAGAVLLSLCEMHGILSTSEAVHALAASLGADVPLFLQPQLVAASGIGDRLQPIIGDTLRPIVSLYREAVVVYPRFPSPVAHAYALADSAGPQAGPSWEDACQAIRRGEFGSEFMRNDLEPALFKKFPVLGCISDALRARGTLRPMLCGSGSSVFALLPDGFSLSDRQLLTESMVPFNAEVFFCDL